MRILFLTHRLPYAPNRGDRIRAYHLLRTLTRAHEVHLLSLVHDDDEMRRVKDVEKVAASVTGVRVPRVRNLLSAALALPGRTPLTHALLHSPDVRPALDRLVGTQRPDLVVAYCSGMARYALEPPLAALPYLLDLVDVDSEKWADLASTSAPPRRWIYAREATALRRFERKAAARAAATFVVSERERIVLERVAPGCGAMVVPNGVDAESFAAPGRPPGEPRVVFCGVFNYGPNEAGALWLAAEVWPLVKHAIPDAQLSLVGMSPTRAVRALSQDPSIVVTGAVPDVRDHLWRAAVSVAPLWLARGVQNKVLEAIAAGLPSIVTPPVFDGLPAAVRPACVVAGDARTFAETIVSTLRQTPETRRAIAARADLSQLTWDGQLRAILSVAASVTPRDVDEPEPSVLRAGGRH